MVGNYVATETQEGTAVKLCFQVPGLPSIAVGEKKCFPWL